MNQSKQFDACSHCREVMDAAYPDRADTFHDFLQNDPDFKREWLKAREVFSKTFDESPLILPNSRLTQLKVETRSSEKYYAVTKGQLEASLGMRRLPSKLLRTTTHPETGETLYLVKKTGETEALLGEHAQELTYSTTV